MVLLGLGICLLRLPHKVHEHVGRALGRRLGLAVEDGDAEGDAQAFLAGLLVLLEDGIFAVELRLPVQVRRTRLRVVFIRRIALLPREDVVRRDVDEKDVTSRAQAGQRLGGSDVEGPAGFGILVDLVGESLSGA